MDKDDKEGSWCALSSGGACSNYNHISHFAQGRSVEQHPSEPCMLRLVDDIIMAGKSGASECSEKSCPTPFLWMIKVFGVGPWNVIPNAMVYMVR